jgi:putative endonuclease
MRRSSPKNPADFPPVGSAVFVQTCSAMTHQDEPRRCVYIIRSLKDPERQYIGRTADMASRLASHNAGESPRTARQAPWQVVVLVQFLDERRAAGFEKFLKSTSGRAFVKQYFG